MATDRIINAHLVVGLLILTCPALWFVALSLCFFTRFTGDQEAIDSTTWIFNFVFRSTLPIGVCCLAQSWWMSRSNCSASDWHNLVEFLLGVSGFAMISPCAVILISWLF